MPRTAARRPSAALVALLASTTLLSACGGGSSSAGGSTPGDTATAADGSGSDAARKATDLCPLITAAEMSTLLGYEVAFTRDPSNGCKYDSVKADARTEATVDITNVLQVEGNGGIEGSRAGAEAAAQGTAEDLSGIGDAAFLVVGTKYEISLAGAAVKGQFVTVTVSGPRAKLADQAKTVLALAVSKV